MTAVEAEADEAARFGGMIDTTVSAYAREDDTPINETRIHMNVPVEAIGLVMGIDSLIGMFRCMSNCLGDVAVTSIVAKSEGQMDMEVYRQ